MFEAVRAAGLNPEDFEWVKRRGWYTQSRAPCLRHKPTGYYFMVDWGSSSAGIQYSPATDAPYVNATLDDWSRIRLHVVVWANALQREFTAPNMWAQLARQNELFSAEGREEDNTPFTTEELQRVEATLAEVRELVTASYELSLEQTAQLDRRIGYLRSAARRVGRVDWLNLVLAAVIQLVLQAIVTSDGVQEVTSFIQRSLGDLFDHLRELPPPT